jgi:hypothetical protein
MGCWNTSFWDNDECVDFLLLLFQHMALIPFPPQRISRAYAIEFPGAEFTTFVRHSNDEFDIVQRLLASITKTTLQRAKATDTHFKQKLIQDAASPEMNLIERLQDRTGLTMDHMWTIIHMHVGAPVDDIQELDVLANAFVFFEDEEPPRMRSGTYKISAYLTNLGKSDDWIKEQSRIQATAIHAGVMRYKESMLQNNIQGINNHHDNLEPLKLQFWGVQNTIALVRGEGKVDLSVPQNVWNINAAAEFERHDLRHVDIDATIDDINCSNCHTPGARQEGCLVVGENSLPPLLVCSCGCAKYCRKICQASITVISSQPAAGAGGCCLACFYYWPCSSCWLCDPQTSFFLLIHPSFGATSNPLLPPPQQIAHWKHHRPLHKWRMGSWNPHHDQILTPTTTGTPANKKQARRRRK